MRKEEIERDKEEKKKRGRKKEKIYKKEKRRRKKEKKEKKEKKKKEKKEKEKEQKKKKREKRKEKNCFEDCLKIFEPDTGVPHTRARRCAQNPVHAEEGTAVQQELQKTTLEL